MSEPLSANNPKIKWLVKLIRDRRFRRSEGALVVEGPRALDTFVACDGSISDVFTDDPDQSVLAEVSDLVRVHLVDRALLDRIADTESPQGLMAVGVLAATDLEDLAGDAAVVVLDGIQDPGNVGAIVRVAAAVGAVGVVCGVGCADPFSPKAVRASAGTVAALKVVTDVEAGDAVHRLGEMGFWRIGTTMNDGTSLSDDRTDKPKAVVLGSEGGGLSAGVVAELDEQISIPMAANVESLNVAVTAGVVLYGLQR